MELAKVCK